MKNVVATVVLGAVLCWVAAAHGQSPRTAEQPARVKVAVIEFTPAADVSGMTDEAKRQLQASIAFALVESDRFDVVDVRHTRTASRSTLAAINSDSSTAAAVKVGKQLGVAYVLTGMVTEYTAMGDGTVGQATLRTRLVEVATGKIKSGGDIAQTGTSVMRSAGVAEMHAKVLKPAIERLTESLVAAF